MTGGEGGRGVACWLVPTLIAVGRVMVRKGIPLSTQWESERAGGMPLSLAHDLKAPPSPLPPLPPDLIDDQSLDTAGPPCSAIELWDHNAVRAGRAQPLHGLGLNRGETAAGRIPEQSRSTSTPGTGTARSS